MNNKRKYYKIAIIFLFIALFFLILCVIIGRPVLLVFLENPNVPADYNIADFLYSLILIVFIAFLFIACFLIFIVFLVLGLTYNEKNKEVI